MPFTLVWTENARETYNQLKDKSAASLRARQKGKKTKTSPVEGLFKQIKKCADLLKENPRHPGLNTHEFRSQDHPYAADGKVFEDYVQHDTPVAYRLFWLRSWQGQNYYNRNNSASMILR
jgi:hypothetical protein